MILYFPTFFVSNYPAQKCVQESAGVAFDRMMVSTRKKTWDFVFDVLYIDIWIKQSLVNRKIAKIH